MRAGIAQYGEAAFAPARSSDWAAYQVGLSPIRQVEICPSAPHGIQDRTSGSPASLSSGRSNVAYRMLAAGVPAFRRASTDCSNSVVLPI